MLHLFIFFVIIKSGLFVDINVYLLSDFNFTSLKKFLRTSNIVYDIQITKIFTMYNVTLSGFKKKLSRVTKNYPESSSVS